MKTKLISLALLLFIFFNANSLYCQWYTSVSVSGQQVYTLQSGQSVVSAGITISYWGYDPSIWGQYVSVYLDGSYQGGGYYPTSWGFYLPQGQHTALVVLTYSDNGGSHTSMDAMAITVNPAPPEHGGAMVEIQQTGGYLYRTNSRTVTIASGASASYGGYAYVTCGGEDGYSASSISIQGAGASDNVYVVAQGIGGEDGGTMTNPFTSTGGQCTISVYGYMNNNTGVCSSQLSVDW